MPITELITLSNNIRKKEIGNKFELCSILNAKSGLCSEDCKFCAQSSHYNTNILIYPLKNKEEIINAAKKAKQIGAERFGIVTSGYNLTIKEIETISFAIKSITNDLKLKVCASLGVLNKNELLILKEAGLSRYHHNIETSKKFYPKIVTTHDFDTRIQTIKEAKNIGLEICSGGIIGLGENWDDRIDMAFILKDLDVDSIPLNILIPINGTPLEKINNISCYDIIRTIAIFRIILKNKTIKIAAGRESILKDFQSMAFIAGANGMLIGDYLTTKGRSIDEDHRLVNEILKEW